MPHRLGDTGKIFRIKFRSSEELQEIRPEILKSKAGIQYETR